MSIYPDVERLTRKVQIAYTELCTFDVNRQIHLATSGQVLDITVSAVLGPPWYGAGSLFTDLLLDLIRSTTSMHILWLRR